MKKIQTQDKMYRFSALNTKPGLWVETILQLQMYLFLSETEPYADTSGVPRTQKSSTFGKESYFSIFYNFLQLFVNFNTLHMTS